MAKSLNFIHLLAVAALLAPAACAPVRGLLPSHNKSAGGGAPAPSLLGGEAAALSAAEKKQAMAAEYQALEYKKAGEAVRWAGARASGAVVPGQPYRVGAQNCRQYSHEWQLNGAPHMMRGSACRNEDGSWTPLL